MHGNPRGLRAGIVSEIERVGKRCVRRRSGRAGRLRVHRAGPHDHLCNVRLGERFGKTVGGVPAGPRACDPPHQGSEHDAFGHRRGDEAGFVNPVPLAKTIDPACSLLEPCGAPRQLVVDHRAASQMEVQSLGCRVGRDQNGRL